MGNRDITYDILKGIGIILMIAGHTLGWKHFLYPFIYAFHIPLFFFVSGYLYKPRSLYVQICKDSKRLLLPYVVVTICEMFLVSIHDYSLNHRFVIPYSLLWESISPIWFLFALFWLRSFFCLILIISRYYVVLSFFISSIFCFLTYEYNILLPFSLSSALGALIFFAVGSFVHQKSSKYKWNDYKIFFIPMALLLWINTSINGSVDTFTNTYKLWIIDYLGALGGIYVFLQISRYIAGKKSSFRIYISRVGVYSIVILSFHSIEYIFPQWFHMLFFLPSMLVIPAILLCRLLFAYFSVCYSLRIALLRKIFNIT